MNWLRRTLGALLIAGAALTVTAPAASATLAAPATPAVVQVATAPAPAALPALMPAAPSAEWCRNTMFPYDERKDAGCFGGRTANQIYLPSERWADSATTLHSRKIGGITNIVADLSTTLQRDASFPVLTSIANTLWSATTTVVSLAVRMDFMSDLGGAVDSIVSGVGKTLITSPIVVAIVVIGIIVVAWRGMRGRANPMAYLGRVVLTLSVMAAMVFGASASTISDNGTYTAGRLSPGWLAQTANGVISSLASAPAAALSADVNAVPSAAETGASGPLSCSAYVTKLNQSYIDSAGGESQLGKTMQSAIPMTLSRMWEQTGLQAWKVAQFGGDNEYADWMYCRLLEHRAGISPAIQHTFTQASGTIPELNSDAAPWGTSGDNDAEDRNLIAWAACRLDANGAWTVNSDWSGLPDKAPTADECSRWWSDDYFTGDGDKTDGIISGDSNFDWSGKPSETVNRTNAAPEVRNYVLSLHGAGSSAGGNQVMVLAYLLSAFIMLLVFGVLSLAILFFKLMMVVMTFSVIFTLLRDLLPSDGPSATGKLAKTYVGIAFVVFGFGLVLALVTTLTGLVISGASTAFGGGSVTTMIITGVAPLVSLVALHWVFKNVLKMPSPLSITGANAWGKAAAGGAVGGAVGAGAAEMMQRRGGHMVRSAGRSAAAAVGNRMRPGMATGPGRAGRPSRAGRSSGEVPAMAAAAAGGVAGGAAGTALAGGASGPGRSGRMARGGTASRHAERLGATGAGEGGAAQASLAERTRATAERRVAGREATEARRAAGITGLENGINRSKAALAEKEHALRNSAKERRATAIERRGFNGGAAGAAYEGVRQRMAETRAEFDKAPLRTAMRLTGKSAATTAKVAALTVATGGMALPAAVAYGAYKQTKLSEQARRRAVNNHAERKAAALEASKAEEAARRQERAQGSTGGPAAGNQGSVVPGIGPGPASGGSPAGPAPERAGASTAAVQGTPAPAPGAARPDRRPVRRTAVAASASRRQPVAQRRAPVVRQVAGAKRSAQW
ncbi:hypothetical protein [Cellulosimicrobium sp. Marseille-Q4280]|uniref:hypothetical protein n=1 Tax=Cellulosimicrobium sp. Marseille-Q4280 TaxID=2937992 RepID=UPI0020416C21|nr:hypothetical protein [Cellulosimicrobium sp. Marseille-Q4280]